MLLKDAQTGHTYVVENIHLPFQLERRLEALGMTRETPVSILNERGYIPRRLRRKKLFE